MTTEEYFGMIILALTGLTLIAFFLVFLYMIYGEREESIRSSKTAFLRTALSFVLFFSLKITSL